MYRNPPDSVPQVLTSPLTIADQGSFFVGGRLLKNDAGCTTYVNHMYVAFQKPLRPRQYPLVMWHGGGQTGKSWESTADGREGYNTIWLRRGYSVFLVDEPNVGRGGRPCVDVSYPLMHFDQRDFESFRRGTWNPSKHPDPQFYAGSQVSRDPWAFAQAQKQFSKNLVDPGVPRPTSPDGVVFEGLPYPEAPEAGAALFDAIGPAVLVNHSHGGFLGWSVALRSDNVRGIIAYEPARFVFPVGERPGDLGTWTSTMAGQRAAEEVALEQFRKLTRIPIQIVYGDYMDQPGTSDTKWRDASKAANAFRAVANRLGGDVEILHLPDIGITGNSHFPFSDLNNVRVAEAMDDWLRRKRLDGQGLEAADPSTDRQERP
jgi:hypothetical protein